LERSVKTVIVYFSGVNEGAINIENDQYLRFLHSKCRAYRLREW
jgi:hypothetical protein